MSKPVYGGQAVIEGVMMRGQRAMSIAVRAPSGQIVVHTEPLLHPLYNSRWGKKVFLRGLFSLADSLALGVRALMYSAKVSLGEEAVPEGTAWGVLAFGLGLAIALFFVTPVLAMGVIDRYLSSPLLSNIIEKAIRLALIIGYIAAIGLLPDIRRVYAYHGAEHKAVNAYEDGAPLEPTAVSAYRTVHPRCGTSFLLIVVVVSFIAFALLGQPPLLERVLSRIVLLPVIVAVAYELVKWGAAHQHQPFVRALLLPGLALQQLTLREPTLDQVEVAVAALQGALSADTAESTTGGRTGQGGERSPLVGSYGDAP